MGFKNMIDLYELLKTRVENKPYIFDTKGIFYNEMREVFQELLLHALSQNNFFENNAFQGGTALRLIHGSKRYSEDLDFNMKNNDSGFSWDYYFSKLYDYCKKLGFEIKKIDRESREGSKVKSLVVNGKDIIGIIHDKGIAPMNLTRVIKRQNIKIKLETGFYNSRFNAESKTLLFPETYPVEVFDIHCLFAGKLHAILNRSKNVNEKDKDTGEIIKTHREDENKGRDWYDFISYIQGGVEPNWRYFKEKLKEIGKWKGQEINADEKWLKEQLKLKMEVLDYNVMNEELSNYLEGKDEFILNKDIIDEYINMMGKDGYKIRYNKDDNWGGGNSGSGSEGHLLYTFSI